MRVLFVGLFAAFSISKIKLKVDNQNKVNVNFVKFQMLIAAVDGQVNINCFVECSAMSFGQICSSETWISVRQNTRCRLPGKMNV
jgi:hypothetical protein